jgi:hypothetical protein
MDNLDPRNINLANVPQLGGSRATIPN